MTESATSYQQRVDLQRATSEFTTIIKKGLHLQPITNNLQTIATKKWTPISKKQRKKS